VKSRRIVFSFNANLATFEFIVPGMSERDLALLNLLDGLEYEAK
jgi:hypothetical protein